MTPLRLAGWGKEARVERKMNCDRKRDQCRGQGKGAWEWAWETRGAVFHKKPGEAFSVRQERVEPSVLIVQERETGW